MGHYFESAELMLSEDYKDRFQAEIWQTEERVNALTAILNSYHANQLDIELKTPIPLLEIQLSAMETYLNTLKARIPYELDGDN